MPINNPAFTPMWHPNIMPQFCYDNFMTQVLSTTKNYTLLHKHKYLKLK